MFINNKKTYLRKVGKPKPKGPSPTSQHFSFLLRREKNQSTLKCVFSRADRETKKNKQTLPSSHSHLSESE